MSEPRFVRRWSVGLALIALIGAEVTDTTGFPEPFLECVADTVWEVEWPRAPTGPAEIIFPVLVMSD